MAIDFTEPRHFVPVHASSFTSPFFFISSFTCFFNVRFDSRPLSILPCTSTSKAFPVTFSSSFVKENQILKAFVVGVLAIFPAEGLRPCQG